VTARRAINTKIAVIGPLSKCGVADVEEVTGIPKGKPFGFIGYLTVGRLQFYQGKSIREDSEEVIATKSINICKKLNFELFPPTKLAYGFASVNRIWNHTKKSVD